MKRNTFNSSPRIKFLAFSISLGIIALSLSRCEEEIPKLTPPIASFKITPENGATTTIFQFDANETLDTSRIDTMLFFRWDWNNDEVWDTDFSRNRVYNYRYFQAGTYSPKLEVRNAGGLSDTIMLNIQVVQGYSPPQPSFTVEPDYGHIRTVFHFDASKTKDDEDSLETLMFRWDWENDGLYDTDFEYEYLVSHVYPAASNYQAKVEVRDPSGLSARGYQSVTATIYNPNLVVDFIWTPEIGTTADTYVFDASQSHDPDDPSNPLTYRWDFDDDGVFDTEYLSSPLVEYKFLIEGDQIIRLEIRDQYGLIKQGSKELFVGHSNMPPTASMFVGFEYGNLTTDFYFNAKNSTDSEDWGTQLKFRWDFESDGTWDTEYSTDRDAYHHYGVEGTFKATVQVMDSGSLSDTTSQFVFVGNGTNETGIIINHNQDIYYGTVKIGNQWWMAENLNASGGSCYSNRSVNCDIYGALYRWPAAMNSSISEGARGLCPLGWHIPSNEEWQELIDLLGPENARRELEVGGSTDFRMLHAGQRTPAGAFEFQGSAVNFWTSSKGAGSNATAFSFQAGKDTFWKLILGQSYGNSVRCIKD